MWASFSKDDSSLRSLSQTLVFLAQGGRESQRVDSDLSGCLKAGGSWAGCCEHISCLRSMRSSPVGRGPSPSATLPLLSPLPLLAAQIQVTIFTCRSSQMFEEKQKLPSGGKAWGPRQKHSKADCRRELQWWRDAPPSSQPSRTSARVSRRAPGVPPQWRRCCSFPSPRLEQDIKKLKADLQASRQVEQELRSQISSLSSTERGIRSEMGQLRQENELLQNKYVHLVGLRQRAKQPRIVCFRGLEYKVLDDKRI